MNTCPIVYVKWIDHYSLDDWTELESIKPEPQICESSGFLVYEDDEYYSVANTVGHNSEACCTIYILKCCVKEFKKLTT